MNGPYEIKSKDIEIASDPSSAAFFIVAAFTVILSGVNTFKIQDNITAKKELKKTEPEIKKEEKKFKPQTKKEVKKPKPEIKNQGKKVPELILPDLNLKTATVLNLFEDVNYNLNTVRYEKVVKPI